ncbi:hypothetical protein D3C79_679380 [compost metagenome]
MQVRATLLGGIGLELGQVLHGKRLAAFSQVTQKTQDLVTGLGHFGRQAQLGVVGIAEQFGQLLTQVEDFAHHRAVVELAGIRALIRSTRAVGGVDFLAQSAIFGVGHHRVVARKLKADQPAFKPLGLGRSSHLRFG